MSTGASFNYKFGPKNNWRRAAWNRIRDRLAVPARDAVVLYFAGKDDLDRPIALDRGFKSNNLIAIERNSKVAMALRANRTLTINSDIVDALVFWKQIPVHVLFADFCCGVTDSVIKALTICAMHPDFRDAVLAFNVMRGREQLEGEREYIRGKHRGKVCASINMGAFENAETGESGEEISQEQTNQQYRLMNPWFSSYASTSGQVFDSAVWRNCSTLKIGKFLQCQPNKHPVYRQISAVKAIRTMRRAL